MTNSISKIYEAHHIKERRKKFSILEQERAGLISKIVGWDKEILDLGCRDGTLTKYYSQGNNVTGVDVDEKLLGEARQELGIKTIKMDINGSWEALRGRKFDAVIIGEVLEHLYFPEVVLSKIREVLGDGGVLVGSVPNAFSLKNRIRYLFGRKKYTPLADPTHINQFHYRELKSMLEKEFEKVEIVGLGRYKKLSDLQPNLFAFDLFFKGEK